MSKDVGTTRIPVTGERHGADSTTAMFCFQFKVRRSIPVWMWDWLKGIRTVAERNDKIGVLVIKRPRMEDAESLVILTWKDWVQLHGSDGEVRSVDALP